MTGIFGKSPRVERTQQTVPSRQDPAVEEARQRELEAERRRAGRASTLLTGGRGVTAPAPGAPRTLLGQ